MDITEEFFKLADSFEVGEYVKDPAVSFDNALLMPELYTHELDVSQHMGACYQSSLKRIVDGVMSAKDEQNDKLIIANVTKTLMTVLCGAKLQAVAYHEVFIRFLDELIIMVRKHRINLPFDGPAQQINPAFIKEFFTPVNKAVFLQTTAIIALFYYYNEIEEHWAHCDDLCFFDFQLQNYINKYVNLFLSRFNPTDSLILIKNKPQGDLQFDYGEFITTYLSQVFKSQEPELKPILFMAKLVHFTHLITAVDQKQLIAALGSLDNAFMDYMVTLDGTQMQNDYFNQQVNIIRSSLFLGINDSQHTKFEDEMLFSQLNTTLLQSKKQVSQIQSQLRQIINDSPTAFFVNATYPNQFNSDFFSTQLNPAQPFIVKHKQLIRDFFNYSKNRQYQVHNCNYDTEQPFFVRLAYLRFLSAQSEFMTKQFAYQFTSSVNFGLSGLLYKLTNVEKEFLVTELEQMCGIVIKTLTKSITTIEGKVQSVFKKGLQSISKCKCENKAAGVQKCFELIKKFVTIEYLALNQIQAEMSSLVTTESEMKAQFNVLFQLSSQALNTLQELYCGTTQPGNLNGKFKTFKLHLVYIKLRTQFYQNMCAKLNHVQISESDLFQFSNKFKFLKQIDYTFTINENVQEIKETEAFGEKYEEVAKELEKEATAPSMLMCQSKYNRVRMAQLVKFWMKNVE
ncbi:Conserved_hypothetical protein [Hexamita inflata]|uniref:Uncharacterized protein n=1 Tax=Hexamita inflata TaxID=28002 RepID=A0AA86NFU5_9EUKA|nr:Conserved hypothetical protein [Hexamita inflata]